jgi:hypothetical protein
MRQKLFQQNNGTLSLIVLTWLRKLQQFFLNEDKNDKNGDWNIFGKFTGTPSNHLRDTPLANINFSSASSPNILIQITKITQFKPSEEIKGVYTSLEEWALRILQPEKDQEFQLKELYDYDAETIRHWDRVVKGKKPAPFNITTKNFTAGKDNIDGNTKNDDLDGLGTNTNRHEGQSNQEPMLVVNTFFNESLQKADKRMKLAKKFPKRTRQHEKSI